MKLEITDQFRITVALSALSHKPWHQSVASYVLDLKHQFPFRGRVEVDMWRNRALSVEEQLRNVTDILERERSELEILRAIVAQSKSQEMPGEDEARPKKKRKVAPESKERRVLPVLIVDWNAAMRDLDPVFKPVSLIGDLGILGMLAKLDAAALETCSTRHLLPLVHRCIMACGEAIRSTSSRSDGFSSYHTLNTLATLFPTMISQALSLLPASVLFSEDTIDVFIRATYEQILRPVIQNLGATSAARVFHLLKRRSKQPQGTYSLPTDIRTTLRGICLGTLDAFDVVPHLRTALSVILAHESVQQLQKELKRLPVPSTSDEALTSEQRIQRLVFEDVLWYLANILHASFTVTSEHEEQGSKLLSPTQETMKMVIWHDLTTILQTDEKGDRKLGRKEWNMLVGLAEMAWTSGWIQSPESNDETSDKCINGQGQ